MSHASTILPLHGPASCRAASGHASKAGRGARVVLLMPAATDTRVFQRAFALARHCLFIRGRVKFGVLRENRRQAAASHGSVLFGLRVDLEAPGDLGVIAKPIVRQFILFV
jgi:hypothetical protein